MKQETTQTKEKYQSEWERRETLSYMFHLDVNNIDKCNEIISAFRKNESLSWTNLTLLDEAYLQKQLRELGFDMKCYGLDHFPTDIIGLKNITYDLPIIQKLKQKYYKHKYWITDMLRILTNFSTLSLALVVLGLVYFNSDLVWPAVILSLLIYNLVIIIIHDDWAHQFIKPKNKFIGYVFNTLAYMSEVTLESIFNSHPKQTFRQEHIKHHNNWKTEHLNEQPHWLKILFFPSYPMDMNNKTNYMIPKNSSVIDKNYFFIVMSLHICLFYFLDTINYFYFVFLQGWLYLRWRQFFIELSPHYTTKGDWRSQQDHPWLFVLCANGGYHISHHKNQNAIILGNGGIKKYFSIQYWFIYLFYTVRKDVPII